MNLVIMLLITVTMKISHTDGLKAIKTAITYIEQQQEATPALLLSFKKWGNIATENHQSIIKNN